MFNELFTQNSRLHFTVIIGSNDLPEQNLNAIIHGLNSVYGGLTYSERIGTWNDDAVNTLEKYNDSGFMTEIAHQFDICTDNLNEVENMQILKNTISPHVIGFANWVHVESHKTNGLHFSAVDHMAEKLESVTK